MGTLFRPENYKMWKWIGYITAVLPLVGVLYGGLRIASDLQTSLEQSIQTSADAHARIDSIAQSQKDINKQLLDLQSISAEVNGIVGSLERQKNDSVTRGQLGTLRDQLSALRESISAEVNNTRIDDDKRIHNVLKDIEEIFRRLDRANID
jgi:cell division protein FtsX